MNTLTGFVPSIVEGLSWPKIGGYGLGVAGALYAADWSATWAVKVLCPKMNTGKSVPTRLQQIVKNIALIAAGALVGGLVGGGGTRAAVWALQPANPFRATLVGGAASALLGAYRGWENTFRFKPVKVSSSEV